MTKSGFFIESNSKSEFEFDSNSKPEFEFDSNSESELEFDSNSESEFDSDLIKYVKPLEEDSQEVKETTLTPINFMAFEEPCVVSAHTTLCVKPLFLGNYSKNPLFLELVKDYDDEDLPDRELIADFVSKVLSKEGLDIEATEANPQHGAQFCFIVTNNEGERFYIKTADIEELEDTTLHEEVEARAKETAKILDYLGDIGVHQRVETVELSNGKKVTYIISRDVGGRNLEEIFKDYYADGKTPVEDLEQIEQNPVEDLERIEQNLTRLLTELLLINGQLLDAKSVNFCATPDGRVMIVDGEPRSGYEKEKRPWTISHIGKVNTMSEIETRGPNIPLKIDQEASIFDNLVNLSLLQQSVKKASIPLDNGLLKMTYLKEDKSQALSFSPVPNFALTETYRESNLLKFLREISSNDSRRKKCEAVIKSVIEVYSNIILNPQTYRSNPLNRKVLKTLWNLSQEGYLEGILAEDKIKKIDTLALAEFPAKASSHGVANHL